MHPDDMYSGETVTSCASAIHRPIRVRVIEWSQKELYYLGHGFKMTHPNQDTGLNPYPQIIAERETGVNKCLGNSENIGENRPRW
jgi:hypothetical protein